MYEVVEPPPSSIAGEVNRVAPSLDHEAPPESPTVVGESAPRPVLRRHRSYVNPVCRRFALPPVYLPAPTYSSVSQQLTVPEERDELRVKGALEAKERRDVEVIVVVVAEKYDVY